MSSAISTTPLLIDGRVVKLACQYLGSKTAEIWIGPDEEGPTDNDDALRLAARKQAVEDFEAGRTLRPSGISVFTVTDANGDGFYELDTAKWPPGKYRFGYHGPANEVTPFGQLITPSTRDRQYSWATIPLPETLAAVNDPALAFYYQERNGAGCCFRISITSDGLVQPAGTWREVR